MTLKWKTSPMSSLERVLGVINMRYFIGQQIAREHRDEERSIHHILHDDGDLHLGGDVNDLH